MSKFAGIILTAEQREALKPLYAKAKKLELDGKKPIIVGHANENGKLKTFDMAKFGIMVKPNSVKLSKMKLISLD